MKSCLPNRTEMLSVKVKSRSRPRVPKFHSLVEKHTKRSLHYVGQIRRENYKCNCLETKQIKKHLKNVNKSNIYVIPRYNSRNREIKMLPHYFCVLFNESLPECGREPRFENDAVG
jgi:hypothetical protein